MEEYDFIAIGDTMTDAFIKLKDASVHCDLDQENCTISMRFKDKIPYESMFVVPAVGNAANAAVSAARLGLRTALVTDIGEDTYGKECLETLAREGVSGKFIRSHRDIKTNYHFVLWFDNDRTILVKHEDFPYKFPDIDSPKWVYLTSLGENTIEYHEAIQKYLEAHPSINLAFQPGTFQMKAGKERMKFFYERSEVFFCNKQEAEKILGLTANGNIKELLKGIMALGPKIAVITDGPAGAYAAYDSKFLMMPSYPDPKPPYERTGAGDAFSSTFAAALAMGFTVEQALQMGPINSMSVVQYVGAREGLLTREKLEEYLKEAPSGYKAQEI